ncbi:MAG: glycosyltransferase, partial [Candidatus Nitrosotenuis sp.]
MVRDQQIILSICTVHHGDERYVRQLVRSIEQYTHSISYEIIVVDNMADRPALSFPMGSKVTVIKNTEMRGYAANLNAALRKARGEYCAILNNDILILPPEEEKIRGVLTQVKSGVDEIVFPPTDSICGFTKLIQDFKANPDIDCMGPMILLPDGTIQVECARGIPTIVDQLWELLHLDVSFPSVKLFNHYKMLYWDRSDSRQVECLLGA